MNNSETARQERDSALRIACTTLVASNDYVEGAMVLAYSLRKIDWDHETIVLVTPDITPRSRERLSRLWPQMREVQPIATPHADHELGLQVHAKCYTKLRIWELTDFDRAIFIDADAVVLGSLAELLDGPEFAAAPCATAPDLFNTAVMAITPSQTLFDDIVRHVGSLPSYDGSDQGFLNSYFADWFHGEPARRLPIKFNTPRTHYFYRPSWNRFCEDMRILHLLGPPKPWETRASFTAWLSKKLSPSLGAGAAPTQIWKQLYREMQQDLATAGSPSAGGSSARG